MASRTKQKEEARARRLAEEQAHAERSRRNRRLGMLTGVIVIAVIVVGVAIAVSSGGNSSHIVKANSSAATLADKPIFAKLQGIPQSGNTLGKASAPVTVTEFGDLECPVCADFATKGIENQLIANAVRTGKAKLVYRSLETATSGAPNPGIFGPQQAAALAAGKQGKAWQFIELFYHQQGAEGSGYVNQSFLNNIAKQIPGLDFNQWLSDSHSQSLLTQVSQDETTATGKGYSATPTIVVSGPKGQTQPIVGVPTSYSQLLSAINSVS